MPSVIYDVAVVGSGFAGSLLAMILRRQGRSVILLEKGRHPRFAIGESTTPLSNLLLEELARRYDLGGVAPLTKWGTWQDAYPNLDCGLKRGFTFYHHQFGKSAATRPDRQDQLLVAASPNDAIADTHWYRADVDHYFVREAQRAGVEYFDEVKLQAFVERDNHVELRGRNVDVNARFVVDATGPRGFLHQALNLGELPLPGFPPTQGLYTHFRGVGRMEDLLVGDGTNPPYPPDDAALHHVFDGGWMWVLRFRSGITSAGVAAVDPLARQLKLSEGAPAWDRLLQSLPSVRDQFAEAAADLPFTYAPRLAFRSAAIVGKRWALAPSAAGFVDPLLSTGFPLTLLGVMRLADLLEKHWDSSGLDSGLAAYAACTEAELLATANLIGALYASMDDFPLFTSLTMLYFAAASFSEAARRLERPHLADSFLLHDRPGYREQAPALLARARNREDRETLNADILRAIEPFNIAGLGRGERRNWYPVDPEDLIRGAGKLEAGSEEIARLLDRSGFPASRSMLLTGLQ